jgi:hypothetical protein
MGDVHGTLLRSQEQRVSSSASAARRSCPSFAPTALPCTPTLDLTLHTSVARFSRPTTIGQCDETWVRVEQLPSYWPPEVHDLEFDVSDLALPAATATTSTARAIGPETAVMEAMPARDATTRWLPLHPYRHHRSMPQPQGHQRTKVSLL